MTLHDYKMLQNPETLAHAINTQMPFGKHKGQPLLSLPEPYLEWFYKQGFPNGKLGEQLALIYEIKLNGLESMLQPLVRRSTHDEDL